MTARPIAIRAALAALLASVSWAAAAQKDNPDAPRVPYVPTPDAVVEKMLEMAAVTSKDVVYDLGCGDGRIVITAAKKYGARGVGIDINPVRIAEANENLKKEKVGDKVKFVQGDIFNINFSEATVVTLYLLPDINLELRPHLWRQLPVGARVVSHDYAMGDDWPPEQVEQPAHKVVYKWTIKPEHKAMADAPPKK
jgi:SAM-dependent methyltransferase